MKPLEKQTGHTGAPFGNTALGEGLGCAAVIIALGTAAALLLFVWLAHQASL